jgi:hypothetical protein
MESHEGFPFAVNLPDPFVKAVVTVKVACVRGGFDQKRDLLGHFKSRHGSSSYYLEGFLLSFSKGFK